MLRFLSLAAIRVLVPACISVPTLNKEAGKRGIAGKERREGLPSFDLGSRKKADKVSKENKDSAESGLEQQEGFGAFSGSNRSAGAEDGITEERME